MIKVMIPPGYVKVMFYYTLIVSTLYVVVTPASGQRTAAGFISIDCGSAAQHRDPVTNLTWDRDEPYILTGQSGDVPNPPDSSVDNSQALRTFKYFTEPQSKYCYELPTTTGNISILLRAMFLHGQASELVLPIVFGVYVNGSLWDSVQFRTQNSLDGPNVLEAIFFSPGNVTYVCLVPDQGVPFISSLELRQLDTEGRMYDYSNRRKEFLSRIVRYNVGITTDVKTVRYPDDAYDRLWTNPGAYHFQGVRASSQEANGTTSSTWNNVPPRVMMDAWTLSGFIQATSPLELVISGIGLVIFYCEAVGTTEAVNMAVSFDDEESLPFNATRSPTLKVFENVILGTGEIVVTLSASSGFTAYLNAMEVYQQNVFDTSNTSPSDELIISSWKSIFDMAVSQGDPCVPVPYDWLTCTGLGTNQQVSSLTVSSLNMSKVHNLATIDDYSFRMLSRLSITNSGVDDAILQFLNENVTRNAYLQNVSFSFNNISLFPYHWDPLPRFVNLSHNNFRGMVVSFSKFAAPYDDTYSGDSTAFVTTLQTLDFSYNSFDSFPDYWGNTSQGVKNLTYLDLSHNLISSEMSSNDSLSALVRRNPSLKEIHISHNLLTGVFPSDFYFSKQILSNLTLMTVDRNNLTGLLDLSIWYQQLYRALNTPDISWNYSLYSFTDNNILDISPNMEVFQSLLELLIGNFSSDFNRSGVLLGGNPICNGAKSLTARYLCRSSVEDVIHVVRERKRNIGAIIGATVGGALALLVIGVLLATVWTLARRLSATSSLLREVQQELTNRDVQPPFYSFHDLKLATRDFHPDNKMGSGGFGAVYKGILPDGHRLAVKRLFNSERQQVLNEFLNEVVLITGIKHKNLIQLKGCCIKDRERILVYELAEMGNLAEALWGKEGVTFLDWEHRMNIAVGVGHGLSYLHEGLQPRIIHRDIKAVNILLDADLNAKVADFGLAKPFAEGDSVAEFTAVAGTRGYFAPEYVLEGQLTTKADVFSFGILLLEIATGRKCIDPTLPEDHVYLKNWAEELQREGRLVELLQPRLRETCPEEEFIGLTNIALSCVQANPKLRPTMSNVVMMLLGLKGVLDLRESPKVITTDEEDDFDFDYDSSAESARSINMKKTRSEHRSMHVDHEEAPFLRRSTFPARSFRSPRSEAPGVLELSSVRGR